MLRILKITALLLIFNSTFIIHSSYSQGGWISQISGTSNWMLGVYFTDANTGTAVGIFGTILRTTNGGTN